MRVPHIYETHEILQENYEFLLNEDASAHLCRVLRFKSGNVFTVFDKEGKVFNCKIEKEGKKALVKTSNLIDMNNESPLYIELGQVISRGDKMDFTIQKATELGVNAITPLMSTRCGVKLDEKRMEKKIASWQKVAIAACEQSLRQKVPVINNLSNVKDWCAQSEGFLNLTLDPRSSTKISELKLDGISKIRLLIGSEGGFTEDEVKTSFDNNFKGISLGPRILRTETAALVCLSILGSHFGDL